MNWRPGQSYSSDLRERVLASVDQGQPVGEVARRFSVSVSFIDKALARRRMTGETVARAQCNHQRLKLLDYHAAIRAEVEQRPDATLNELRDWLFNTHGITASLGLMHKTMARLGLTRKKKSGRAAEQEREDVAAKRAAWRAGQAGLSDRRLIFIDETGASMKMDRRYGRCPRGQRLDAPCPHGHWKTTTFVAGLTNSGFLAPYVLDGPMDGAVFKALRRLLAASTPWIGSFVS